MRVAVEIETGSRPKGAIGLLVPKPIDLPWQSFNGFAEPIPEAREIAPEGRGAAALFVEDPMEGLVLRMHYRPAEGDIPSMIFEGLNQESDGEPSIDAVWMEVTGKVADLDARTRAAVAEIAQRFNYGPRNTDIAADLSSCDMLTGNCIDINTVLLSYLDRAGVPASYIAGYYFAAPDQPANGMHCWVATCTESGYLEWDVAHALQDGREATIPLNQNTRGLRVAVSYGRNIAYRVADRIYKLDHFVQPRWLMADGTAQMATVKTIVEEQ